MKKIFDDLKNGDPAVREAARQKLGSLSNDDFARLQRVGGDQAPQQEQYIGEQKRIRQDFEKRRQEELDKMRQENRRPDWHW